MAKTKPITPRMTQSAEGNSTPAELFAALLHHPETPDTLRRDLSEALTNFQNEIDLYQLTQTSQSIQLTFDLYRAGQEMRKKGGAK